MWRGNTPPRPVLYGPSSWLPSGPARTTSPSVYLTDSGPMLPAPPRPWETSKSDIVIGVVGGGITGGRFAVDIVSSKLAQRQLQEKQEKEERMNSKKREENKNTKKK